MISQDDFMCIETFFLPASSTNTQSTLNVSKSSSTTNSSKPALDKIESTTASGFYTSGDARFVSPTVCQKWLPNMIHVEYNFDSEEKQSSDSLGSASSIKDFIVVSVSESFQSGKFSSVHAALQRKITSVVSQQWTAALTKVESIAGKYTGPLQPFTFAFARLAKLHDTKMAEWELTLIINIGCATSLAVLFQDKKLPERSWSQILEDETEEDHERDLTDSQKTLGQRDNISSTSQHMDSQGDTDSMTDATVSASIT